MNEQNNPNDYNVVTTAEQLVAGLWQAERDGEIVADAPPSFECVEDEVKALETTISQHLQSRMDADEEVRGSIARFRIIDLSRITGADVPLWRVGGCDEGPCPNPECKVDHHNPHLYLVTKRTDGTYVVLDYEEIFDETEKNHACFGRQMMQGALRINLGDIVSKAIEEKAKELAEKSKGPDGDDDDLPPAARVEEAKPDEKTLHALKAFLERPQISIGSNDDTTAPLPVIDIDEYRVMRHNNADKARPSWLRRVWRWLWNWLRSDDA